MADFQLLQEAWDKLSSQMNEMAATDKLLKKVVKSSYKQQAHTKTIPKKPLKTQRTCKKIEKTVEFAENQSKDNKDTNKIPKGKNDASDSKKNVISKTNSVRHKSVILTIVQI